MNTSICVVGVPVATRTAINAAAVSEFAPSRGSLSGVISKYFDCIAFDGSSHAGYRLLLQQLEILLRNLRVDGADSSLAKLLATLTSKTGKLTKPLHIQARRSPTRLETN